MLSLSSVHSFSLHVITGYIFGSSSFEGGFISHVWDQLTSWHSWSSKQQPPDAKVLSCQHQQMVMWMADLKPPCTVPFQASWLIFFIWFDAYRRSRMICI